MAGAGQRPDNPVILGQVSGLYGVRGWVKVYSHTRPRAAIFDYDPWLLRLSGEWQAFSLRGGKDQGKVLIAHLEGCGDREQAAALVGADIAVEREQLPPLKEGEYYWWQLEGLQVVNIKGDRLGRVDHLIETGANDVLVVENDRRRLIPYIPDVIQQVDLETGTLVVDWDADF